ncbi:LpqN/LpqT family lipoprotein [Mycobacterium paraffinicum]|uniref:Proline-rich 28 kDa antigen n=1 Tax=Mycobacterium paraffinicum TaxID=53378 RepID=A0ABP8RGQ8_9MYCO|nr:LpqN/LpqT family lipoprotein [Mycobacterium paraffinicum]MCV7310824.1 LpqN/LpqT family lipoprotein [Mycobacterium paraffinicum]
MIEIVPARRALLGGMVAGLIGMAVVTGAQASADPLLPAPAPAPAIPAPQNVAPGQAPTNRFLAAPPAPNPVASPTAPGATVPAAAAPAAPVVPAVTPAPATSGTIREYLQSKGVKLEAQKPQGLKALDITLPVPARWTQVPDPNVPDAFAVIADRQGSSIYSSNAQVVVYKLVGDFDPREAISHGYVDSQKLLAWQPTNASMADFGGFPSSIVEGTYRDGDMTLNTSRRHVIATSGRDRYLVSLAVTTDRAVAVADAPATDAIVNGFRVTVPGAPAPAPVPTPAASPVALTPAQAPVPPVPATAPVPQVPATAPVPQVPATAPVGQIPATAPVGQAPATPPVAQAPAAAPLRQSSALAPPVGLPQAPMPSRQPTPNLLALVPGLPPLPNFTFLQH